MSMIVHGNSAGRASVSQVMTYFPFLNNMFAPDPRLGWSPRRSRLFGAACLEALLAVVEDLGRPRASPFPKAQPVPAAP
jgi:hypothetical protein